MDYYKNLTKSELETELKTLEKEFEELKTAVATGLKRLNELAEDYKKIKEELNKRI